MVDLISFMHSGSTIVEHTRLGREDISRHLIISCALLDTTQDGFSARQVVRCGRMDDNIMLESLLGDARLLTKVSHDDRSAGCLDLFRTFLPSNESGDTVAL